MTKEHYHIVTRKTMILLLAKMGFKVKHASHIYHVDISDSSNNRNEFIYHMCRDCKWHSGDGTRSQLEENEMFIWNRILNVGTSSRIPYSKITECYISEVSDVLPQTLYIVTDSCTLTVMRKDC